MTRRSGADPCPLQSVNMTSFRLSRRASALMKLDCAYLSRDDELSLASISDYIVRLLTCIQASRACRMLLGIVRRFHAANANTNVGAKEYHS